MVALTVKSTTTYNMLPFLFSILTNSLFRSGSQAAISIISLFILPKVSSPSDPTMPGNRAWLKAIFKTSSLVKVGSRTGAKVEGRQVSSAKSWLSHQAVDRNSDILPWQAQSTSIRYLRYASASYLNHIRQAWNYRNPSNKLEDQDVVVTVPASFDETARKLDTRSGRTGGLR